VKYYPVMTDKTIVETEAMKFIKPGRILISYFYIRTRPLSQLVEKLGYQPEIMLDSGAYSAFTKGKNISPLDYVTYIKGNAEYISHYIALDVIGDAEITKRYYEIMRLMGTSPLPVFHYGSPVDYLDWYVDQGCQYIALGATVPVKDKTRVAAWITELNKRHPSVVFHLLGSASKKIWGLPGLESCDSAAWILQAVIGKPRHIPGKTREDKLNRAVWNMQQKLETC